MNFISGFLDFWEILTGVIDDNKAKIIRFLCFALLVVGIGWAVFNFFRADLLSNTNADVLSTSRHYGPEDDEQALRHMANLAQTVQEMRRGGTAIANHINEEHTRPFNTDASEIIELKKETSADITPEQTIEEDQIEIIVRAIETEGKKHRAVLDIGNDFKGHLVKRGTKLPNDAGTVTNITKNKVTIRRNRKNYEYIVQKMETDLERKLQGKSPNSSGGSKTSIGQNKMGVEQFVFEGTVPENSPLTTSVKEEELKK